MTHKDIYTKFMIEYDKANVTSSYPSLTKYEIATILDKAYYAFIAQKLTGNNPRRAPFESDVKSVADLQQLIKHTDLRFDPLSHQVMGINIAEMKLPTDFMYFVQLLLEYDSSIKGSLLIGDDSTINSTDLSFTGSDDNGTLDTAELYYGDVEDAPTIIDWQNLYYSSTVGDPINSIASEKNINIGPYDKLAIRLIPVKLTSHSVAEKFMATPYNMPWVKIPVAYILDEKINVVYDPINKPRTAEDDAAHLVYICKPAKFAKTEVQSNGTIKEVADLSSDTMFELSDSSAEEVINLAVIMALENVESSRLGSKLNTMTLES